MYCRFALTVSATLLVVTATGSLSDPATAQSSGGDADQSAPQPPPQYHPPMRGAPQGRVGAASRGNAGDLTSIEVLAPDHVGLTTQEQPTLYWFSARPVQLPAQLTIIAVDREKPLLEIDLPRPLPAGIHAFPLGGSGVRLTAGTEYEWSVAVVVNPAERSNDIIAGGIIQRVAAPDHVRRAASASPAEAARIYAQAGLWYDAVDVLSRAIAKSPSSSTPHRDRSALLEQVGLADAAAYDRRAVR